MAKLSNEAVAYQFFVGMQLKNDYPRFGANVAQRDIDKFLEYQKEQAKDSKHYRTTSDVSVVFPGLDRVFPDLLILKDSQGGYYLLPVNKKQGPLETFVINRRKTDYSKIPGCVSSASVDLPNAWNNPRDNQYDVRVKQNTPVVFSLHSRDFDEMVPGVFNRSLTIPRLVLENGKLKANLAPHWRIQFKEETRVSEGSEYKQNVGLISGEFVPYLDPADLEKDELEDLEACWQNTLKIDELLGEYATLGFFAFGRKGQITKEITDLRNEENERLKRILIRLGAGHILDLVEALQAKSDYCKEEMSKALATSKDKTLTKEIRERAKNEARGLGDDVKGLEEEMSRHQKIVKELLAKNPGMDLEKRKQGKASKIRASKASNNVSVGETSGSKNPNNVISGIGPGNVYPGGNQTVSGHDNMPGIVIGCNNVVSSDGENMVNSGNIAAGINFGNDGDNED